MKIKKIGIIRESKAPADSRSPLSPNQIKAIEELFPDTQFVVQTSKDRCFADEEFKSYGIEVVDSVEDCDVLFGIKEVSVDKLIPNKTYFFFSHTIKKQPYNRKLLQEILKRKIRLIDYECLVDENNIRVIAFGRWAGIIGTYNAFWAYGMKYGLYKLKRAYQCSVLSDLLRELKKVTLPPVKIIMTGNGRVAKGALEILKALGIKQVEPAPFFYQTFDEPVFTQVDVNTYYRHKKNHPFHFDHFFKHPEEYVSDFIPFTHKADMLINAIYWNPRAPGLFSIDDMKSEDFKVRVVADITCDMNGSIPSTIRATTIEDPIYDFDPVKGERPAFSLENGISVMAIDVLPNELPREASAEFGRQLIENVLPVLLSNEKDKMIKKATIADKGKLTTKYKYLLGYVEGM